MVINSRHHQKWSKKNKLKSKSRKKIAIPEKNGILSIRAWKNRFCIIHCDVLKGNPGKLIIIYSTNIAKEKQVSNANWYTSLVSEYPTIIWCQPLLHYKSLETSREIANYWKPLQQESVHETSNAMMLKLKHIQFNSYERSHINK